MRRNVVHVNFRVVMNEIPTEEVVECALKSEKQYLTGQIPQATMLAKLNTPSRKI